MPFIRLVIGCRDGDGRRIAVVGQNRGGHVFVVNLVDPLAKFQTGDDGFFRFPQLVIDRGGGKRDRLGPGGNGDAFAGQGVVNSFGGGSADDNIDGLGFGRVPGAINSELDRVVAGLDAGFVGRLNPQ